LRRTEPSDPEPGQTWKDPARREKAGNPEELPAFSEGSVETRGSDAAT
jgi:hypothetical protein